MNIGKKIAWVGLIIVLLASSLTSCKKGDDDPWLSFRSRKSRLTGTWTIKNWSEQFPVVYIDQTYLHSLTVEESTVSESFPFRHLGASDSVVSYFYSGTLSDPTFEIKENGDFSFRLNYRQIGNSPDGAAFSRNRTYSASGTWSFLDGVGKYRNKECVLFEVENSYLLIEGPFPYRLEETSVVSDRQLVLHLSELSQDKISAEGSSIFSWTGIKPVGGLKGTIAVELSK